MMVQQLFYWAEAPPRRAVQQQLYYWAAKLQHSYVSADTLLLGKSGCRGSYVLVAGNELRSFAARGTSAKLALKRSNIADV